MITSVKWCSCRYSITPATTSGCVVAPNSAGAGTTRFGLIPIREDRSPIRESSSAASSSRFVISLYSVPYIFNI